ncbi:putative ABC transporter extracellular- binding protein YurO [Planktothrix tepida]|uniref:Extracellular solute-binding protein, family 1 n=1 Tax=Planktothrix tepida PCC 9214 TaxID=671072 RepID=A0A1J1LG61_9CYAN|nr:ABC transporter substrate-binding protein [Planktothrix tepida]CAD5924602.1 putative ABC transporter extracellular- binding protein YurO [Planktothrix tepida]CUR31174.1 Extracellular solute-binding protein, family 1 [Planktothrix tepida PCC 9214]
MIYFSRRLLRLGIVLSIFLILLSNCQGIHQKQDNVIHLSLWQSVNPPPNRDVFERLVNKFNQTHPDIQIESIFIGQPQLPKILTAVVGNSPPDLLVYDPQTTGQFAELGAIQPLDEWVENLPFKSDIVPGLFEQLSLEGHIWSSPLYTANLGIFYRPKLFQLAGITELPKTWEEFRQVAKKLTIDRNGDRRPEQYGLLLPLGKGEWTVFSWFPFLLSAGGEILTNNQPNFINPGAIHALQFWQDLIKEGSATLSQPERGYEEADFISGRVAMQITGPWTYITKSNVDYQVFPIPTDIKPSTVTATGNIFVMKTTSEREKAALKFLEFVLSEEFQTEWAMGTDFLPVNLKSVQSQDYQEYLKSRSWLKVFVEQMSVAGSRPIIAGYTRISDTLGSAIEATLLGQSSAESALKEAQKRLEVIFGGK